MKTKHTPGPWTLIQRSTGDILVRGEDGVNLALVTVADIKAQGPNARLISLAPEMLAFIRNLAEDPETPDHVSNVALSLISRAEGK